MTIIHSISYDQEYIIKSIMQLCSIERFDVDVTYANGSFWKNLPQPLLKFDIDPQTPDTICANSGLLPLTDNYAQSIMFDHPFLTYVRQGRNHNTVMGKRFGGYWTYNELEEHYKATINEAHRVLKKKGILTVKCQDIIHNHAMHCTHINVVDWAKNKFRLKDLFVLAAKHRMPIPPTLGHKPKVQKHARIHHSYFLVLEKNK